MIPHLSKGDTVVKSLISNTSLCWGKEVGDERRERGRGRGRGRGRSRGRGRGRRRSNEPLLPSLSSRCVEDLDHPLTLSHQSPPPIPKVPRVKEDEKHRLLLKE